MSCNTCTICLDSVIGDQPIGVVYPCGHVFHQTCWDGWVAAKRSGLPKCAMCNRQSQGFSRLYLDFLGTNDDNVSLSSSSDASITGEDEKGDEANSHDEEDTVNQDKKQCIAPGSSAKNALAVEEEQSSSNSDIPKVDTDKYKKVAKQLKQRNKYLASKAMESSKELEEVRALYQAQCDERIKFENEIRSLKDELNYTHLAFRDANLEATTLKRQLAERESSLKTAKATLESLKVTMERIQKSHDEGIRRARETSMAEVKQMLRDYPKVVRENQELKKMLSAVDSNTTKQVTSQGSQDRDSLPKVTNQTISRKRKLNMLKEIGQTTSTKAASSSRIDEREAEIQQCLQKSSCATVLSRTFQPKHRRAPLDVLNSNDSTKRPSMR